MDKILKIRQNQFFNKIRKNSNILKALVSRNFKSQYRNSILGAFWTVLNPLLNMIVLSLVFSNLFGDRPGVGCYPIYLFCGTLFFNMMRQITSQSLTSLVTNSGLIKKVKISYSIFPMSNMFTALVNFGVSFVALIAIMLILRQTFHWTMLLTVAIVPAVLLFSLGIGLIVASLYVYFRDIKHLYEVFLTLWMYLTPLFYTADSLKSDMISKIINLNPMTHFISAFRNVIQFGIVPSGMEFLICYAWALSMLVIGYTIYRLSRKRFILYI